MGRKPNAESYNIEEGVDGDNQGKKIREVQEKMDGGCEENLEKLQVKR